MRSRLWNKPDCNSKALQAGILSLFLPWKLPLRLPRLCGGGFWVCMQLVMKTANNRNDCKSPSTPLYFQGKTSDLSVFYLLITLQKKAQTYDQDNAVKIQRKHDSISLKALCWLWKWWRTKDFMVSEKFDPDSDTPTQTSPDTDHQSDNVVFLSPNLKSSRLCW